MNTEKPSLPQNPSIKDMQDFADRIYAQVNGRNFELGDIVCRLSRFDARVLLRVRQGDTERTGYHLCMMLSWIFALANRLFLETHEAAAKHCAVKLLSAMPLSDLQELFALRHKNVGLLNAALCLAEKVAGIASALEYYRETHDEVHFMDVARRMAQSIEALLVVASKLEVSMAAEFLNHFRNGCCRCFEIPCRCGFRADKVI